MIIIFKKFRALIEELKKDFFEAKDETYLKVLNYFNLLVISVITAFFLLLSLILCFFNLVVLGIALEVLTCAYFLLAIYTKVFRLTGFLSSKLLFYLFGRFGKVVGSKDWKNIKKNTKRIAYKFLTTKKSEGKCYFCSWYIALFLRDAQIMYCSQLIPSGPSGHAVIVKDNCVYDTNDRKHYDYNEYIEFYDVKVYRTFSETEYRKESFFDDIRGDFVEWCKENNVYCDPE